MQILITIDVEGQESSEFYESVEALDQVLSRNEWPVTMFVTPDVVENRPSIVEKWIEGDHAVELHLHPERLPNGASGRLSTYSCDEITGFLSHGKSVFEDVVGHEVSAFRAGRWEYSSQLLRALSDTGFERDSSLRPEGHREPYVRHGVTELPISVYTNRVLRLLLQNRGISGIPLHVDGFLRNRGLAIPFFGVTWWLSHSNRPYLMVSFHDYDLRADTVRNRIIRYLDWLTDTGTVATFDDI